MLFLIVYAMAKVKKHNVLSGGEQHQALFIVHPWLSSKNTMSYVEVNQRYTHFTSDVFFTKCPSSLRGSPINFSS